MKNKSGHHKATNRFKFVTFADRVNSIDIRRSALYRLEHLNSDEPEENETYFHNTLTRWKVLNLTNEYLQFTKRYDNIVTLPQLLHKKEDLINRILEELTKGNVLNLQPFLELVVALARDLQEDFYQNFPKFLECLIKLLNTKDPEQLEWTFICLAFLFKHLRLYLKRDISIVIKSILPLLSENTKWYVRNFAAESFAFVARDVKDKKKFLEIVIKAVQSNEDAVSGCGHLLFEVIRGIGRQFHSSADQFLPLFFSTLKDTSVNQKILFDILTQTVGDMLETIEPKSSKIFWDSIVKGVQLFFDITVIDGKSHWKLSEENASLEYVLMLIGQCLEHKNGKFLIEPLSLLDMINNLIDAKLSEKNVSIVSQIAVLLLMCSHINLPHLNAVYFVKKILSIPYSDTVTNFVQEVVSCSSFDVIIFPYFLEAITQIDSGVVSALSKICLKKSPLCKNGSDLYSWVKYPIDLASKSNSFNDFLRCTFNFSSSLDLIDDRINAMVCLPHINNLDLDIIKPIFKSTIEKLLSDLKQCENKDETIEIRNLLYFLAITIESSVHIMNSETLKDVFKIDRLIDVLINYTSDYRYICSLRIIDLVLTLKESEHNIDYDILLKIYPVIEDNLMSPFHELRLITTHICSLFEIVVPENMEPPAKKRKIVRTDENGESISMHRQKESFKVFSLCYTAESIALSVEGYREQLLKLSKTMHDSTQYRLMENLPFKHFPVKFMLGFLNVNLKLVWEPVQNLILTFANGLPVNEFWEIFHPCLIKAAENVKSHKNLTSSINEYSGKSDFLKTVFQEYFEISDKPDYMLYRIHLWEILFQASTLCEVKNRDLTTLFLEFLKTEFEIPQYATGVIKNIEEEEDENKLSISKYTYDALIVHLKIYSNIQNPKAVFKEKELKTIYYDFLMHKNPVIQKVALDCLMKYKNKHWTPYKDQLYNLVDGKKFKEELRLFKLNEDSEVIKSDDREELMQLVLRIAFSKMITNTGIDKKGGSQMRRSLVMRFIAGCSESELITFTEMAFKAFLDYINLDLTSMHSKILSSLQHIGTMSPKKLLGCINLVENMREQFIKPGETKLLPILMKVIFCIGTFAENMIHGHDNAGYVITLKNIRSNCLLSLGNFFKQFEDWSWSEEEVLYIYNNFVWTIIKKLPIEGIHSPTPLLKLFNTWSQNPRLHSIFRVYCPEDKTTPIHYILSLLASNKLRHSVYDICMSIIERFLTLESEDSSIILSEEHLIPLKNEEIVSKLKLTENLNLGSCILLHNISELVHILKDKFERVNPKRMQKRDIVIISRVTEIVYDPGSVDILLKFSLPILIQKIGSCGSDDDFTTCIDALTKLLNKSSNPKSHMKTIIPLFSKVKTGLARKHLCNALNALTKNCDDESKANMIIISEIITEMNASDEKWIDQPDFERRLAVYKRIYQLLEDNSIGYELGSLIVQNCFFTIANSNDISLRSNASSCLQKIIPKLLTLYHTNEFFVQETVLNLINNGLKSDNENLKNETITLLGELVRECHDYVATFKELHPLSNKSNREIDFFENLQHLQVHRKIRAFLRFCNHAKTSKTVPSSKTLTQFILPLASQYICNEKFVEKYSLVEAAIDTVVTVCRLLPWHQYEQILRYYLGKLHNSVDHQKQLIKIISMILDAFHFDLSKANNVEELISLALHKKDPDIKEKVDEKIIEDKKMDVDIPSQINEIDDTNITEEVQVQDILPYERIQTLSPSAAKRVIYVVTAEILVQLNWSSSQVTEHEASHKSLRKDNSLKRETEDKLRIPMGFAIVKLLQKLPEPMLKNNILSIIIKVCNFLTSPLVNVRASARDILCKIMMEVGSKYFNTLLSHLTTQLTKGFQVHVLIVTVHTLLESLQNLFTPQEMNSYLDNILKVCFNDLFGHASEERDVVKLGHKAPEAKPSKKVFLTLRIIAQKIGDSSIIRLLTPFKNIIQTTNSKRIVLKIEGCFQYISLGLVENPNISIESILIFLCGLLSDSIPKLSQKKKVEIEESITLDVKKPAKTDCFLIPPDPKGNKKMPKSQAARISSQANNHVITEFGLNMLQVVLQKEHLGAVDSRPYLDPMVPFIIDALKSPTVRVSTLALKCITSLWNKKIVLPTLKDQIEDAIEAIFDILHKYATSGLSKKDENFHLVLNSFKAISTVIRSVNYYTMTKEQIKTLLMYAEHDILDHEKQATAFSLLKTILAAKFDLPEIKQIIKKVAEITITNESPRAREESAYTIILYLMNYPTKKMEYHIKFYVSQLEYKLDHGRIAAVKILQSMIDSFTENVVTANSEFLFISLGMRLVYESNNECRGLILKCIEKLLMKIDQGKRNELFNVTMVLLSDNKATFIEMASYLSSLFINIDRTPSSNYVTVLLPKISEKIYGSNPNIGRFVKIESSNNSSTDTENKDASYIQLLKLLCNISEHHPRVFSDLELLPVIDEIGLNCQNLLAHSHSQVRLNATKFLVKYLESLDSEEVFKTMTNKIDSQRYFVHSVDSFKSLVLDLVSQLISNVSEELASTVCKIVSIILKLIDNFPTPIRLSTKDEESNENYIDELWVIRKIKSALNSEVVNSPGTTVVRFAIFEMLEELTSTLSKSTLSKITMVLVSCLVREITKSDPKFESIKNKAIAVNSALNDALGNDVYNEIVSKAQTKLMHKRNERKIKLAQDKVNNPVKAAKRKEVIKEKKREYKKMKLDKMKGRSQKSRKITLDQVDFE